MTVVMPVAVSRGGTGRWLRTGRLDGRRLLGHSGIRCAAVLPVVVVIGDVEAHIGDRKPRLDSLRRGGRAGGRGSGRNGRIAVPGTIVMVARHRGLLTAVVAALSFGRTAVVVMALQAGHQPDRNRGGHDGVGPHQDHRPPQARYLV